MADSNLQVGIDSSQAVSGGRTVVRSLEEISQAVNTLNTNMLKMESTFGKIGSNAGMSQAKQAIQSLQNPLQSVTQEMERIESRIIRIGATALAIGAVSAAFGRLREVIGGGIKAVEDFQNATIAISAGLTNIAMMNGKTDLANTYKESSKYAAVLALKLQEIDANSFANYKGLMAMLQVMTNMGIVLDVNNKKQVQAYTDISNAIAIMTPGQDQQMQMYQETGSLLRGQVDMRSALARSLDMQIKQEGIYKNGLKEVISLDEDRGKVLERLASYMKGITAAGVDIKDSWQAVKSTFETAMNIFQRAAFTPIVKEFVGIVQTMTDGLKANADVIATQVQEAWAKVRNSIFDIDSATQKLTFKPEFLATIGSIAEGFKNLVSWTMDAVAWTIKHAEALKNLTLIYVSYRAAQAASALIMNLTTASTVANTEANGAQRLSILGAFEAESARLAQMQVMAAEQVRLTGLEVERTAAEMAAVQAGQTDTASMVRQTEVMQINTQSRLSNASAILGQIASEIESYKLQIQTTTVQNNSTSANLRVAQSRYDVAAANKLANATLIETLIAEQEYLATSAVSAERMKQLAVSEAELITARSKRHGLTVRAANAEAQLAIAQDANVATTTRLSTAKGMLALKESELAIAQRIVLAETVRNNAASAANSAAVIALKNEEIIARNANAMAMSKEAVALDVQNASTIAATTSTRALVAAKQMLTGVVTALGGPFGALLTALTVGATAWMIWGNSAKEALGLKFEDSIEAMTNKIRKQTEELKERARILDKGGASNNELDLIKKEEEKLAALNEQIKKLGGPVWLKAKEEFSTLGGNQDKITQAKTNIAELTLKAEVAKQKISDLKQAITERDEATPKAPPSAPGPLKGVKDKNGSSALSEEERAFNKLREEWDAWDLQAIRASKVQDELGAALEVLSQKYINLGETAALASKIDAKGTEIMMAHIAAARDLAMQYASEKANKKADAEMDKALAAQVTADYKSNLAERKSELSRSLEDRQINQQQYFDLTAKMIQEESSKEILALQKVVDEKKQAIADTPSPRYDLYVKATAELVVAETNLDKVRSDGAKRYNDNIRQATVALRQQEQALNALNRANKVDEAKLQADGDKSNKFGNPFKAVDSSLEAEKEAIKAKYEAEREQITLKLEAIKGGNAAIMEAMNLQHEQVMTNLDAENKLRIAGITDANLRKSEGDRYEKDKLSVVSEYTKKATDIRVKGVAQATTMQGALEKAYTLTFKKEGQEKLTAEQKANNERLSMYAGVASFVGDAFTKMAESQDQTSRDGFEAAKKYSIAAAVMNTAAGIMQAFATSSNIYVGIAMAALVAATGAIQIAKISSTSYGGGGSVAAPPTGAFGAGGGGTGYSNEVTGSKIGDQYTSVSDSQTTDSLQALAKSAYSASLAIGKVSVGFEKIAKMFAEGSYGSQVVGSMPGTNSILKQGEKIYDLAMSKLFNNAALNKAQKNVAMSGSFSDLTGTAAAINITKYLVDKLGSKLFGGTWAEIGTGITISIKKGMAEVMDYTAMWKDGGLFGKSEGKVVTQKDEAWTKIINNLLQPVKSTIERAAITLGTKANIENTNIPKLVMSTVGKTPAAIAKELETWMQQVAAAMAKTIPGLKSFTFQGENAYMALLRLNNALVSTNVAFDLIGKELLASTLVGANFAYKMQELMGGMDAFNKAMDTYFTSMYTTQQQEAMKLAVGQRQITAAFKELNIAVPESKQAFIDLVNGIDVTTAEGAALFAALIEIAPAFALVQDAADAARKALKEFTENIQVRLMEALGDSAGAKLMKLRIDQEKEMQDAIANGLPTGELARVQALEWAQAVEEATGIIINSVQKLIDAAKTAALDMIDAQTGILNAMKQIKTGPASMLTPEAAYLQAQTAFNNLKGKTDLASLQQMPQAANDLLAASKNYNASGAAYQSDLAEVLAALGSAAGLDPGTDPTLQAIQEQIDLLKRIRTAIETGNAETLAGLDYLLGPGSTLAGLIGTWNEATAAKLQAEKESAARETFARLQVAKADYETKKADADEKTAKYNAAAAITGTDYRANLQNQVDTLPAEIEAAKQRKIDWDNATAAYVKAQNVYQKNQTWQNLDKMLLAEAAAQAAWQTWASNPTEAKLVSDLAIAQTALSDSNKALAELPTLLASMNTAVAELPGYLSAVTTLTDTLTRLVASYINATGDAIGVDGNPYTGGTGGGTPPPPPPTVTYFWEWLGYPSRQAAIDDYAAMTDGDMTAYAQAVASQSTYSYATGTPYVPYDQIANIHEGEAVIDKRSMDALRKYGVSVQNAQTSEGDESATVAELKEQNRLLGTLIAQGKTLTQVNQLGFMQLVDTSAKQTKIAETNANTARLVATQ